MKEMKMMGILRLFVIALALQTIFIGNTMLWGQQVSKEAAATYIRGVEYYEAGDFDRAIAEFDKALRLAPDYGAANFHRGVAYIDKGEYDKAIADLTKAIQWDPMIAQHYHQRGFAYYMKKDYDKAISDFTYAIRYETDGTDIASLGFRGFSYYCKADYSRAIADFEAVLRIKPNDATIKKWLDAARQARGK